MFEYLLHQVILSGNLGSVILAIKAVLIQGYAPTLGAKLVLLIPLIGLRDLVWKFIALRKAGTNKRLIRFICLAIFNTAGILPILYLLFFQKKVDSK